MPRTNVGTIDEAEEIEQRDGWNGIQVELPAESALGSRVEMDKGATVLVGGGVASFGSFVRSLLNLCAHVFDMLGVGRLFGCGFEVARHDDKVI